MTTAQARAITSRIVRCACPLCGEPTTFAAAIPPYETTEEWLAKLPFEGQERIHELHEEEEWQETVRTRAETRRIG